MCDCSGKQRIQKQQFCVTVGFHYHDWPVLLLCEITLEALVCLSQRCHLLTKLNIALAPHQVRVNEVFRSVLCQTTVTTKTKKGWCGVGVDHLKTTLTRTLKLVFNAQNLQALHTFSPIYNWIWQIYKFWFVTESTERSSLCAPCWEKDSSVLLCSVSWKVLKQSFNTALTALSRLHTHSYKISLSPSK